MAFHSVASVIPNGGGDVWASQWSGGNVPPPPPPPPPPPVALAVDHGSPERTSRSRGLRSEMGVRSDRLSATGAGRKRLPAWTFRNASTRVSLDIALIR